MADRTVSCVCKGLCGTDHGFGCKREGIPHQMQLCRPCQEGLDRAIAKGKKRPTKAQLTTKDVEDYGPMFSKVVR